MVMDYMPEMAKAYFALGSALIYLTYHDEIHEFVEISKNKCLDILCKYIHRTSLKLMKTRSNYIWITRKNRCHHIKKIMDKIFIVDPVSASVNSSSKSSERVVIDNAIVTRGVKSKDVTNEMRRILVDFDDPFMGDNGQITIDLMDIVPDMATDNGANDSWCIEITYRGHSDPSKRIEARTYSVKYKSNWKDIITFPPYSIHDMPARGLGSEKILTATTVDGDMTHMSRQYAGMKVNFYNDCSDEVLKNHMNISATVKSSKGKTYVVGKKK